VYLYSCIALTVLISHNVTGKSIQTIGLILSSPPKGVEYGIPSEVSAVAKPSSAPTKRCTLIVCPVSVLSNWTDQINQFVAPGVLSVELYHGPNRDSIIPEVKAGNVDVLLVSYNTLAAEHDVSDKKKSSKKKTKRESIFDIDFHRIVLDEGHTIRNSKTQSFKAVSVIKADFKLALTGTPFVNTADDIYSLLSFLGVEPLNEKSIFTRAITQPIKNGDEMVSLFYSVGI
jgi:SWI/SNF-related matrix-associated actin-dependent regulator of chromatin subfamily A3